MCVNSPIPQIKLDILSAKIENPKMRCSECNKKINITNSITCKCEKILCYKHRYQTDHNCQFDFRTKERELLSKSLIKIENDKVIKI
jgi:hypothetical protein